jgi:hypothetical protein
MLIRRARRLQSKKNIQFDFIRILSYDETLQNLLINRLVYFIQEEKNFVNIVFFSLS